MEASGGSGASKDENTSFKQVLPFEKNIACKVAPGKRCKKGARAIEVTFVVGSKRHLFEVWIGLCREAQGQNFLGADLKWCRRLSLTFQTG